MKKFLLLFLFLISFCGYSFASGDSKHDHHEKMFKEIQEYKIKFLAQEMNLKDAQKEKFAEIYAQYNEALGKNFREIRKLEKQLNDKSSEEDYKKITEKITEFKTRNLELEKEYDAKFSTFLTSKQIYLMKEAQEKFRKKMHEMGRKHREKTKKNNEKNK